MGALQELYDKITVAEAKEDFIRHGKVLTVNDGHVSGWEVQEVE